MSMQTTIRSYLNELCMIPGSMGLWENYFAHLGQAWGKMESTLKPLHLIYSADNGIVKEGHIGFSADITRLHSKNMIYGGAAVTKLCQFNQISFEVIDAGIASDKPIGYSIKAAEGSKNFLSEPAMTPDELNTVWHNTQQLIHQKKNEGYNLFSFGEMGIGNTTTSAAVLAALIKVDPKLTVGPGSGADAETLEKKILLVKQGLEKHKEKLSDAKTILQHLGGFDLVALTASMLACVETKTPYVIDGFITAVAHACAYTINPNVKDYVIPSHLSREPGMSLALEFTGINIDQIPLHGHMALGEGTGAVMMVQLLKMIHYTFLHMTTLESVITGEFTTKKL